MCFNTESTTTFIDKALVESYEHLTEAQKVHSITAYSLTESQVLNWLIHLPIIISAKNSDSISSAIQITTAVYVMKGLKADVLLEMNIIIREMTQIDLRTNSLII